MNSKNTILKTFAAVILTVSIVFMIASCSIWPLTVSTIPQASTDAGPAATTDDVKAGALIKDFFSALYSANTEDYTANVKDGTINNNIRKFIAQSAIDELNSNTEVPFHYPRYIDINGLTMIQYNLMQLKGKDGKESPYLDFAFVGSQGNQYIYYVKCGLVALTIPSAEFENYYAPDENGLTFTRLTAINRSISDEISVQISYDVALVKEDNALKIAAFTESNIAPGLKNRLFRQNNDSVTRLPYLSITNDPSRNIIANPDDVKTYKAESTFIEKFFRKLTGIDRARMDELHNNWERSSMDFTAYLGKLNLPGAGKGDEGKLTDMMRFDDKYKESFNTESFPLVINLQRIAQIKNFSITPHPAYSKNIKRYIVKFTADVEEKNGVPGAAAPYSYDYFVTLAGSGNSLKISDIRLNEYYGVDIN